MKREELELKLNDSVSEIDYERMNQLLDNSIGLGKGYNFEDGSINMVIAMEEFGELTQQISKWIRHKGDKLSLTEELADSTIMMEYVKKVCDISQDDINKIINIKLDRLEERDKILMSLGG